MKAEIVRGQLRIPEGYKPTPFGWADASCIVEIQPDEIYDSGAIVRADGTARVLPPCLKTTYRWDGSPRQGPELSGPSASGWLGSFMYTIALDSVAGSWVVPSAPSAGSQYFYLFNGVTTADGTLILQPVLQWQGLEGTTGKWVIASWRYEDNAHYVVSPKYEVLPGQVITGIVAGSNCSTLTNICSNWRIDTSVQTSANTSVTVTTNTTSTDKYGYPRSMTRAIGGALEGYEVSGCSQMPPDGSATFSGTTTHALGGGNVGVPWVGETWPQNQSPACVTAADPTTMTLTWNTCNNGLTKCSSGCVNLQSSASNCGACGHACGSGYECVSGTCQAIPKPTCPSSRPVDCCHDASVCALSWATCYRITCD